MLDRPQDAVTHPIWIALEIAELLYQQGNEPRLIGRLFVAAQPLDALTKRNVVSHEPLPEVPT